MEYTIYFERRSAKPTFASKETSAYTLFKNAKSPVLRCPSLPYVGNSSFHVAMLKTVKGKDFGGRNKKLGIYFQFLAKLLQKPYIYDFRICRWHYSQTFMPMKFLVYFQ